VTPGAFNGHLRVPCLDIGERETPQDFVYFIGILIRLKSERSFELPATIRPMIALVMLSTLAGGPKIPCPDHKSPSPSIAPLVT
jgi:hypothetical protein